jgi:hypothetical protein
LEVRASFALSYDSRDEDEQRAFRMLGLFTADFPAWALAARLGAHSPAGTGRGPAQRG